VIRKFGTKDSGLKHIKEMYRVALDGIGNGARGGSIVDHLRTLPGYGYLQPDESPYDGVAPTRMSTPVRAGLTMKKLLETGPRCAICGGFVPTQALSVDHIERRADGGSTTSENTQLAHPYCNTGYKESRHASQTRT
jgi:5-methylcytosine-specific restriction endonuclease McrA